MRGSEQNYTEQEIKENINQLTKKLDNEIYKRKSLNKNIRNLKSQIQFWENLNINQSKLF